MTGTSGEALSPYRQQLARVARFYGRVLQRDLPFIATDGGPVLGQDGQAVNLHERLTDYEDDVWSFFVNCWHVRDWLKYDVTVDQQVRGRVLQAVEVSHWLRVCADLANGRKHFELDRPPRVGAEHATTHGLWTGGEPVLAMELFLTVGDEAPIIAAAEVAWRAMCAWKEILEAERLPLPPEFPNLETPPAVSTPRC